MRHEIDEIDERHSFNHRLMVLIPLAIILLLIIFCIIRILIWNKGKDYKFEKPSDLSNLNTESEDYYVAMDKNLLSEHADDGELHILFLGDDIFTYGDDAQSIPNQVAQATGATVYNCAFPQSTLALSEATFNESNANDAFSFSMLALGIHAGDFSFLDYYKESSTIYDSTVEQTIQELKNIDFNKIDIIFLGYGTYDYLNGHMTTDITSSIALNSVTGSLTAGITTIRELYPHIRFVLMSPTFCYYDEGDGTLSQGDIRRVGSTNENLGGYVVSMKAVCIDLEVSFLDNYFGIPLNAETAQQYLVDAIHVNNKCRELIANKVIDYINTKLYWQ